MSHDWLQSEKAKKFALHEFYVQLKWTKMIKQAIQDHFEELTSIYDILDAADKTPKIILVEGT